MKWVNGEITECWPHELSIGTFYDFVGDGSSYHGETVGEDGNPDACATADKSENWMSITSSESSKWVELKLKIN